MNSRLLAPLLACPMALSAADGAPALLTNPLVAASPHTGSADPSVVWHDGYYHYCRSLADGAIGVARAARLQDIGRVPMVTVWTPPRGSAYSRQLWAPELQRVRGTWMIYVAASDGDNATHRMFALQADTDDPQRGWTFKGRVAAPQDEWAIDGIAVEHDGGLYFLWSGWRAAGDGFPQVLYIAPMSDPWTISGPRVEIAAPEHPWERRGAALLEGPAVLYRRGRIFVTYSASASWTDHYTMGMLTFEGGDILDARRWVKSPRPVFAARPSHGVFGPGHNSFTTSPDGLQDWLVYHAIDEAGGGWGRRSVRAQPFGWHDDGTPDFGRPVAAGVPIEGPSGAAVQPQPRGLPETWRD